MTIFKTTIEKDIYKYPELVDIGNSEITIGDIHGNALLLLNILITFGVIRITKNEYSLFVKFYTQRSNDASKTRLFIEYFNNFIDKAVVDKDKIYFIRFLGDMLSDRGSNDYYTLKILSRLQEAGVNYEIMLSNHGLDFIISYELKKIGNLITIDDPQFIYSRLVLANALINKFVSYEKVNAYIQNAYLSKIKVISYSDKDDGGLVFYHHAPVGMPTFKEIAKQLKIPFNDRSKTGIINSIDMINEEVKNYIDNKKLFTLFGELSLENDEFSLDKTKPFFRFVWNRLLDDFHEYLTPTMNYPHSHTHGHHIFDNPPRFLNSLDGLLGKWINANQGEICIEVNDSPNPESENIIINGNNANFSQAIWTTGFFYHYESSKWGTGKSTLNPGSRIRPKEFSDDLSSKTPCLVFNN